VTHAPRTSILLRPGHASRFGQVQPVRPTDAPPPTLRDTADKVMWLPQQFLEQGASSTSWATLRRTGQNPTTSRALRWKSYLRRPDFGLSWAAMIRQMVQFKFIPMDESKVKPELKEQLLTIGRLVRWDYTDDQGTYTGLVVIGEKAIPRGFQTVAKVSLDAATKALPTRKVQELSRPGGERVPSP
jgi:hypothetical protein